METGLSIGAAAGLPSEAKLEASVTAVLAAYGDLRDALEARNPDRIARTLPAAEAVPVPELRRQVALAKAPAELDEIRARVAHLIAVTKHLEKVDGEFGPTLVEDLRAERPSQIALVTAMRRLRTSCKFLPSIAEVIEAVREVEATYRSATYRLENLPDRIAEARATVGPAA